MAKKQQSQVQAPRTLNSRVVELEQLTQAQAATIERQQKALEESSALMSRSFKLMDQRVKSLETEVKA